MRVLAALLCIAIVGCGGETRVITFKPIEEGRKDSYECEKEAWEQAYKLPFPTLGYYKWKRACLLSRGWQDWKPGDEAKNPIMMPKL